MRKNLDVLPGKWTCLRDSASASVSGSLVSGTLTLAGQKEISDRWFVLSPQCDVQVYTDTDSLTSGEYLL
jgi:hypothetical protein